MGIDERLYIGSSSDVPAGTGLGSSSSFTVGLLHALYVYRDSTAPGRQQLAEEAVEIEVNILKNPIGIQDQYGCALGGLKHFYIKKNNTYELISQNIVMEDLKWLTEKLILVWTGQKRNANDILSDQMKRVNDNKLNLLSIKQDSFDFCRAFGERDQFSIGAIFQNGWTAKKQLTPHIINPEIDDCTSLLESLGLSAFRLLGAGGGGFILGWGNDQTLNNIRQNKNLVTLDISSDLIGTQGMKI